MIMEPAEPSDTIDDMGDRSAGTISQQVQRYLGTVLAGVYAGEDAGSDAAARFAELLAKLDNALGEAQSRNDAEFRKQLVSVTPALRRFALSLTHETTTADDLVQDTLLRAWKSRARFERGTNFEAWTFVILRNQFYTDRRKHREVQDEEGLHTSRLISLPDQAGRLDLQDMRIALAQLTPAMRESLMLVTVEGLSYDDAATIMGCQVGTVKSRVWRGRNQLAHLLGYDGGEVGNDAVMLSAGAGWGKTNP